MVKGPDDDTANPASADVGPIWADETVTGFHEEPFTLTIAYDATTKRLSGSVRKRTYLVENDSEGQDSSQGIRILFDREISDIAGEVEISVEGRTYPSRDTERKSAEGKWQTVSACWAYRLIVQQAVLERGFGVL
jgi:hypothetical protein